MEPFADFRPGPLVCRRRQRDPWHAGIAGFEHIELQVIGAEVVPPLRHAMRFVDGKKRDLHVVEQLQCPFLDQAFWCNVEQIETPFGQRRFHRTDLIAAQTGIQTGRTNAYFRHGAHLILHQRDQR